MTIHILWINDHDIKWIEKDEKMNCGLCIQWNIIQRENKQATVACNNKEPAQQTWFWVKDSRHPKYSLRDSIYMQF